MKVYLPFDFPQDTRVFMRRSGYAEHNNHSGVSYVKRLTRDHYPRFHVYVQQDRDNRWTINLHLDQKKASYAGSSMHNGEYDGEQVEREAARIEGLIKNQMDNQSQIQVEDNQEKKKGFFSNLFN